MEREKIGNSSRRGSENIRSARSKSPPKNKDERHSSGNEVENSRHHSRSRSQSRSQSHKRLKSIQKLKDERRAQAWAAFAARHNQLLLGVTDLPSEQRPLFREAGMPMALCLTLHKVDGLVLPKSLAKHSQEVKIGLSVSLYHAASQRPYGTTYMGKPQAPVSRHAKKRSKRPARISSRAKTFGMGEPLCSEHDQLLVWITRFSDPSCLAIIEVVCHLGRGGPGGKQYGLGWTYLALNDKNWRDVAEIDRKGSVSFKTATLFKGSPRSMLFFTQEDWQNIHKTAKPGHNLYYKLETFERALRFAHLIQENEIVSITETIPGLAKRKGHGRNPVIGVETNEAGLLKPLRPKLAPIVTLELRDIRAILPDRHAFEGKLLKDLMDGVPNIENIQRTVKSCFGIFKNTITEPVPGGFKPKPRITNRSLRIALHNGHTVITESPDESKTKGRKKSSSSAKKQNANVADVRWLSYDLEEEDDEDEDFLMIDESIKINGYCKHALVALLVMLEYTIEISFQEDKHRMKKGTKLPPPESLQICLGLGAFCPWDSKRLRLRNTSPLSEDAMMVETKIKADSKTHFLVPKGIPIYFGKDGFQHESDEEDSEDYEEEAEEYRMVGFDLFCFDENGRELPDETPLKDKDESDIEFSDGERKYSESESSKESSDEELRKPAKIDVSSSSSSDEIPAPKSSPKLKPLPLPEDSSSEESPDDLEQSYIMGTAGVSKLRQEIKRRPPRQASDEDEDWDGWRSGIKVPKDRNSLMGKLLQRPIGFDGATIDASPIKMRQGQRVNDYTLDARDTMMMNSIAKTTVAPSGRDMSRASRTRLSRHGFTEVMQDTLQAVAHYPLASGITAQKAPDLDLELRGLPRHEITLQFAAYRPEGMHVPQSVYFSFQFYNCASTKTERMLLRKEKPRRKMRSGDDLEDKGDPFSSHGPFLLVREGRHGRDEPTLAAKFVVDTTMMQPREGSIFFNYLAFRTLYIDVWDGDSLLPLGTMAFNLSSLLRQGESTVKFSREFPVVTPEGMNDNSKPIGLRFGSMPVGPVVGHVQILACNYGEEGQGEYQEDIDSIVRHEDETHRMNFRLGSEPRDKGIGPGEVGGMQSSKKIRRPKHKVRARPLSEANKDVKKLLGSKGLSAGESFQAFGQGRATADSSTVTYEDVLKLVQRFKSKITGRVRYAGDLLRLLDAPDVKNIEKKVLNAITNAQQAGGVPLQDLFSQIDEDGNGFVSLQELQDGLGLICGADISPAMVRTLLESMDRDGDGSVSLGEFLLYVRTRQEPTEVTIKLKRILLIAEMRGTSLDKIFAHFDRDGSGKVSLGEFDEGLSSLGPFAKLTMRELRELLKHFDTDGDGEVSLQEFFIFAGKEYSPVESAEDKLKKVIDKAEQMGTSARDVFNFMDADASGSVDVQEFKQALQQLAGFGSLTAKDITKLVKKFDSDNNGNISLIEFMQFLGKDVSELLEQKLRRVIVKAEERGANIKQLFDEFDKDKGGSISLDEMKKLLDKLDVFKGILPDEALGLLKKLDKDNSGEIEFNEFLNFVYPGSTPLEHRLVLILRKGEEMGLPVEEAFKHFDKNGDGDISREEFIAGLKKLVPSDSMEITDAEIDRLVDKFDKDKNGSVSLIEFLKFMGKDYKTSLEIRLQKVIQRLVDQGISISVAFEHFAPQQGQLNFAEFERGLRALPGFNDIVKEEIDHLAQKFDSDNDGNISMEEFTSHFSGSKPFQSPKTPIRRKKNTKEQVQPSESTSSILANDPVGAALKKLANTSRGFNMIQKAASTHFKQNETISGAEFEMMLTQLEGLEELSSDQCTAFATQFESAKGVSIEDFLNWIRGISGQQQLPTVMSMERKLCRILERFEEKGYSVLQAFDHFDKNKDGDISKQEFYGGLNKLKVFKTIDEGDMELLMKRFERKKAGNISLEAFDEWFKNTKQLIIEEDANGLPKNKGGGIDMRFEEMCRKLRAVVKRSEESGLSMERIFGTFDKNRDGQISLTEFSEGIEQLRLLSEVSLEEVQRFAKKFDYNNDGKINISEFICFIRQSLPEHMHVRPKQTGHLQENDNPDYEYSTDPTTKHVEKKIRRAAQKSNHLDIEAIFKHYDHDNSGTVTRSDFIQVLMELGLSLLERDGASSGGVKGKFAEKTRARQTAQLANIRDLDDRSMVRMRRRRTRDLHGLHANDDSEETRYTEQMENLQMIKWYREGQKKSLVQQILANSLTTEYHIFPRFGQTLFFEHSISNPFNHEERFKIDIDDPELEVVTSSQHWSHLRRCLDPCIGEVGEGGVEDEMIDADPVHGLQTTLMSYETVQIPFVFMSLQCGKGDHLPQARTIAISFISASHGHIVSLLQVHIHPRPFCVDRTLRFYQAEGEIMKRSIQLLPALAPLIPRGESSKGKFGLWPQNLESESKFVHCIDLSKSKVIVEWRDTNRSGLEQQEIFIKYCCGSFPSVGEFYILIYNDHFQASLYELWHVSVHSRLRIDIHALTGQSAPSDLVVRGDRFARRVQAFSSEPEETFFEPDLPFQLISGAYNRVDLRYRAKGTGTTKFHINLVDIDSRELVSAWLVTATASPPVVTKVFEVSVPFERPTHKKIGYSNPWNRPRVYKLHSSNSAIFRPRYKTLEIASDGQAYIRVWIAGATSPEIREAFLFVNDEKDQNEECFLIKIHAT